MFFTLPDEEKADYGRLQAALRCRLQPEEQRRIHKLNFNSRRRVKGENIVDLAPSLRQLAFLAYGERDLGFVEEEMIDQFTKALDRRELRMGVSQARTLVTISFKVENGSTCNCATGVLEPSRKFGERYSLGVLKVVSSLQRGHIANT